jgi:exodeoxyribonuclease VII small subunit
MTEPKPKRRRSSVDPESQWQAEVEQLSFNEARTALELAMAKLQSSELEVEEMATLYRRAEAYANRCSDVLEGVEQEVIEWDTPSA